MRLLKIDPRPPSYDSVAEASLDAPSKARIVDNVEMADWRPIAPPPVAREPRLAFVDGVQRLELRISAEGDGWPIPGALVSYAAGAVSPRDKAPISHVHTHRRVVIARGAESSAIRLEASNGAIDYLPAPASGDDFESINHKLHELRGELEADIVKAIVAENRHEMVVVDGRLGRAKLGNIVGLIKTPQDLYITESEQVECVMRLKAGERSPVFVIEREHATFYSWFLSLRGAGPFDISLSGVARIEMTDTKPLADALRFADLTAAVLPRYASTPAQDARAPQNLVPVGELERYLRHRLGNPELLNRLVRKAFQEDRPTWN